MKQVWKILPVLAGLVALFALGVMSAGATTLPNDSPETAHYVDGQTHVAPVGRSLWYRFDYQTHLRAQDRTPIYLTLVNGTNGGVEFSVYTSIQAIDDTPGNGIEDWRAESPIGRGTAQHLNCNTHIPQSRGDCVSNDLTWVGTFAMSGSYYVRVRNLTQAPANFTLTVSGQDVSVNTIQK
jgi:hypothetical protein